MRSVKTLHRLGATVEARFPLAGVTPRVKNAVMRALTDGYMPTMHGMAASVYEILLERLEMPGIVFMARRADCYGGAYVYNASPELRAALPSWWNADRVAYRMENGEQWAEWVEDGKTYGYRDEIIKQPTWDKLGKQFYVRVMCGSGMKEFDAVAHKMRNTTDYIAKRDQALAMLTNNDVIVVEVTA
jgi:hypothetical protein